jgi:hypothetical protein
MCPASLPMLVSGSGAEGLSSAAISGLLHCRSETGLSAAASLVDADESADGLSSESFARLSICCFEVEFSAAASLVDADDESCSNSSGIALNSESLSIGDLPVPSLGLSSVFGFARSTFDSCNGPSSLIASMVIEKRNFFCW